MPASRTERLFLPALTAIAALSAFLRLETIGQRPLWFDERFTFNFCARAASLSGAWAAAIADGWEHPPLHYAVTYLVMGLSRSPAMVRLPSALCGIVTVILVALLARRLLGAGSGLLAALLLAVSTYHINYSMDARPYPMLLMLLLGEMLLLYRYLDTGRARLLLPLALCATAAVYTHHLAMAAQAAAAVIVGLRLTGLSPGDGAPGKPRMRPSRLLAGLAAAAAGSALLYLPQARNLYHYLSTEKLEQEHTLRLSGEMIWHVSARWGVGDNPANALVLALLVAGVAGILARRRQALGLLAWLVIPFLPFVIIPFGKFWDIRFVIAALPPFVMLVAAGLTFAGEWAGGAMLRLRPAMGKRPRSAAPAAALATALLALPLLAESAGAYRLFRWTRYRCSEFYLDPTILDRDGGFCREHLILNTLDSKYGFLLRPVRPAAPGASRQAPAP